MAVSDATDTLAVAEGYEAMRIFLEAVCQREGRTAETLALILGGLRWADGAPVDPTLWRDWLAAVDSVRGRRAS